MSGPRPRLLLVAHHYPPGKAGGRRPHQVRRYLPERGWDVTVLCARPLSGARRDDPAVVETPRGRLGEWIRSVVPSEERPLFEQWAGAPTEGLDRPGDSPRARALRLARGFLLPDDYLPWIPLALATALRHPEARAAQAVLSTAPPFSAHVLGALLASALRVPLFLDYRDPYTLNAIYPPGPLDRPARLALERAVMRRARSVVCVSEGYARKQRSLGVDVPVHAVPNGWDPEDAGKEGARRDPAPTDPVTLVHTGTVYPSAHDLPALARGLALAVRAGHDVRLLSCGSGGRHLRPALEAEGLADRFEDLGTLSRDDAAALRARGSAQLLFLPSRADDDGTIPSKLFDYLASRKPVLAVGDPACEPGRILDDVGAGPPVPTADAVAARLAALATAQRAGGLDALAPSPAQAARYSGRAMAHAVARVIEQALGLDAADGGRDRLAGG